MVTAIRSFWLSLVVMALFSGWSVVTLAQTSDFTRYELDLTLDTKTHTLSGTQSADYYNDTGQALETVTFVLLANLAREPNPHIHPALMDSAYIYGFDPGWTKIKSVADGAGNPLGFELEALPPVLIFGTYSLQDTLLKVQLPQPLTSGAHAQIKIEFETKFPQGALMDFNYYRGVYTCRFSCMPIAVSPQSLAGEQVTLPNAYYRVRLKAPADFVIAGGADRQQTLSKDEKYQTVQLESDVPTKSVPLALSKDYKVLRVQYGAVTIESYHLPGHERQARLALSYAQEILDYHSQYFGPYAYKRLVIVENPSPRMFGMAADGMILLGTDNYRWGDLVVPGALDRILDYLIAHEIAHLWWGIGVGADFNAENWLSEGFAEYLAYTYFESKYGAFEPNVFTHLGNGVLEEMIKSEFGYFNLRRHFAELSYLRVFNNRFDEAIVKPAKQVEYANATATRIYNKGYLVLRALDGLLGRETMLKVLQVAYKRYAHKIATVEVFKQITEEVSGKDLKSFFDSWLYKADYLDIGIERVESKKTANGYETTVHLSKRGGASYTVTVVAETANEKLEQTWPGDAAPGSLIFASKAPVHAVHADPYEMSPDVNRYNNHWPRKLVVKFGDNDLPLDAYLLRITASPIGLQGGFRTDHRWSVGLMPRVEIKCPEDQEKTCTCRLLWDGAASLSVSLGRGLSLSGLASVTDYDLQTQDGHLQAELGLNWTLYEHPQIGIVSKYWYGANRFRFSLGTAGTLQKPVHYIGIDYVRDDILRLFMVHKISLRAGQLGYPHLLVVPSQFMRLEWTAYKRHRLAPSLYFDVTLKMGAGLDKLPEPMKFELDELHSFDESFANDAKAFGRLELLFPPFRYLEYSLMNLAIVSSARLGFFIQGGQTWEYPERIELNDAKIEVGAQATVLVEFSVLPLALTLGYAYPVIGGPPDATGKFFTGFGLGF